MRYRKITEGASGKVSFETNAGRSVRCVRPPMRGWMNQSVTLVSLADRNRCAFL